MNGQGIERLITREMHLREERPYGDNDVFAFDGAEVPYGSGLTSRFSGRALVGGAPYSARR